MTAPPDDNTADLHTVITTLRAEREAGLAREATLAEELAARGAALARRNSEYGERIEYQAATIDVLKAMSASPGDAQPVFDLIARQAANQCNVPTTAVATFDGTMMHLASQSGLGAAYVAQFPRPVGLDFSMGRAVLNRRVDQVEDITADPGHSFVNVLGHWSVMAVPMLRHDVPLGSIAIGRPAIGPFSASQVSLLQTFAEQAVIAISSAETYRTLQTRTADLAESLEYQTATSDVLKVISRSTFDLQPVLAMVAETAARLCDAEQAVIIRREGDVWRFAVNYGFPPEYETHLKALGPLKPDPDSPTVAHRTAIEGRPVHISDVAAVQGYPEALIRLGKQRTSLGVPLLRHGETVGIIQLSRQRVQPFTERQIELVSTFADQAVIAIENTRLLTEQQEALEQQTATAEVLGVINRSPVDLTPVFDAMLEKAMRLCGAAFGSLFTYDGERFNSAAQRGVPPAYAAFRAEHPPLPTPGSVPARIIETRGPVQTPDVVAGEDYRAGNPRARAMVDLGGIRAVLDVPLLKEGALLGFIAIYRERPGTFSDKQIALLESFAAQAVIAMENARLLTEQREALEQQTATAEVLQVINASPGNLAPVFEAILEKAMYLCDAAFGSLALYEDGHESIRGVAMHNLPDALAELSRDKQRVLPGNSFWRIARGESPIHIIDAAADEASLVASPMRRAAVEIGGAHTALWVALRKDQHVLGAIVAWRREITAPR